MERFCSPLRAELPDIDVDVESARRTEIYEAVLDRFGGERVTCVSMMDTYKVRHAVRDVGAALGLPPVEVDEIAKAFPHIRAKDARHAIADLPELRSRGLDSPRMAAFFDLVEALDGLPRHIALHPCGVVLSNAGLLDRTPVEASWIGFPMSQFDKDDVETLGFLKLDVLGIRMQSSMAHAVAEVARVSGEQIDLDDEAQVPHDDPATYELIRTTRTLGMFQIESPGQRELVGKLGPSRFDDLIVDISLFRPGPVKSDMITPFLNSRHGWSERRFLHPSLIPALEETEGVVVFHEQVLLIVAETTGVTLAQADEVRRSMGTPQGQTDVEAWWRPAAKARGYSADDRDRIWEVLKSFAQLRLLQGARRGLRAAHLPLGLAEDPPPGGLPRRHPHPRPRHVPQAAAARRRPLVRHPGARPRRQRLGRHLPHRAGRRTGCRSTVTRGRGPCRAAGLAARPPAVRHPALARRRQGDQRRRGGPGRRRAALRRPRRLLDPRPGEPPGHRAARARRGVRQPARHGRQRAGAARPGHPARPAAARRRARAVGARGRGGAAQQPAARHPEHRAAARGGGGAGRRPRAGGRAVAGGPRGRAGRRAADPAHPRPRRPAAARRRAPACPR